MNFPTWENKVYRASNRLGSSQLACSYEDGILKLNVFSAPPPSSSNDIRIKKVQIHKWLWRSLVLYFSILKVRKARCRKMNKLPWQQGNSTNESLWLLHHFSWMQRQEYESFTKSDGVPHLQGHTKKFKK